MKSFLKAINVKARIINALFIHAIISEHGKNKIGYLTAIIKPLGQMIMFTVMFSLLARTAPIGDNFTLFIALGLIPYNLCIGLANKVLLINKSYRVILSGTPATPLDVAFAFLLSETLLLLISTSLILLGLGIFGYWDYKVDSILSILLTTIASITLGFGIGLINASLVSITPSYEKIWKILSMPLFMLSGIFFVADRRFPADVIAFLQYNPVLHIVESMRDSFYRSWESTLFDMDYLLWVIISTLAVGLLMQKITQTRARL